MCNYKDIEDFLNDDFFDKDIQEEIRKDLNIKIEKEIESKQTQITKNDYELNKLNALYLRTIIFRFNQ